MFAIDRSYHRDYRREHEEAAVALVRFHHKIFTFPEPRSRAGLVDFPADHKCGVKVRRRQHRSNDRGRSRFAVRAGHGDSVFQPHQLGQHFGAGNDRYFLFVRFDDLGIVRSHGGGGYDDVRAFDVGAFVTLIDGRAEILEALGDRGRLGVRAGD